MLIINSGFAYAISIDLQIYRFCSMTDLQLVNSTRSSLNLWYHESLVEENDKDINHAYLISIDFDHSIIRVAKWGISKWHHKSSLTMYWHFYPTHRVCSAPYLTATIVTFGRNQYKYEWSYVAASHRWGGRYDMHLEVRKIQIYTDACNFQVKQWMFTDTQKKINCELNDNAYIFENLEPTQV